MGQQGKENSCEGGERLAASWAPDGIALEVKLLSAPQRRFGGEDRKWGSAVCCREPGAAYQLFRQSFTAVVTGGPGRWVCYGLPAPKWRWFCIRGGSSGWSRGTPLSSHVSAYISLSWGGWKAGGGVRQLSIGLPGELGRAPAAYRATCSA